jgi:cytidine deaminase
MIMAGAKRIREVAVIAEKLELCPPCGGCRQRLAEFADADTLVHLCDAEGIRQTLRMDELLPHGFKTEVIG